MSIASVITALQTVAATATSAAVKFTAMPENAPARFPAIVTRWQSSAPVYGTLGRSSCGGHVVHTIMLYVIISQRRDAKNEDLAQQSHAQLVIDAINNDASLSGACADAQIVEITPDVVLFSDVAYSLVAAQTKITEYT